MQSLDRLEEKIRQSPSISGQAQAEYEKLIAAVRDEITTLSKDDADQAESIAGFVRSSTHEAMREKSDEQLLDLSLQGLKRSVAGFETSHPTLVSLVNRVCDTLAGMGI